MPFVFSAIDGSLLDFAACDSVCACTRGAADPARTSAPVTKTDTASRARRIVPPGRRDYCAFRAPRCLLGPQRLQRIDGRRPPGRAEARDGAGAQKDERDAEIDARIGRRRLVEVLRERVA